MNSPSVAECSALHHAYGQSTALADVDLALGAGQVSALLGPNGAGKTTLIHLLLGLLPVQRGTIRLFGNCPPGTLKSRRRIGVMLQASGVQHNLTVAELLAMFASFYPKPDSQIALLDELELIDLADRRFAALSGGQKQRALFALAAIGRPDWLILDEPTTGLDPAARRLLWRAIARRHSAGVSILLCTHFMEEAQQLADHVVVLDQGRILAQGSPDAVRSRVPSDRIRLHTRLTINAIAGMPAVQSVSAGEEAVEVLSSCGIDTVRALLAADPEIDRLEVAGADLESAFLALTNNREAA